MNGGKIVNCRAHLLIGIIGLNMAIYTKIEKISEKNNIHVYEVYNDTKLIILPR